MGLVDNLLFGVGVALTLPNLLCVLGGAALGRLVGALPGMGPVAAVAMLLPAAAALGPTPALILLAGAWCGARVGRETAAVAVEGRAAVPGAVAGERAGAAASAFDVPAVRSGGVGVVPATVALGAFVAGCAGTLVVASIAPPLTEVAFRFGPAEYFSLLVLGLSGAVVLAPGSLIKALGMAVLGLLLAQVGTDATSGVARFGMGVPALADGIGFIAIAIGVFAFGEVVTTLGRLPAPPTPPMPSMPSMPSAPSAPSAPSPADGGAPWPTRQDWQQAWPAVLRGTALGALLGLLPGRGAWLARVAATALERRLARAGEPPREGGLRGLAGPAAATHAGTQAGFVPLLALGIPPNAALALMVGALTMDGIRPGPPLLTGQPELFWGLIASLWLVNGLLLILALLPASWGARLRALPYCFLYPALLCLGGIGLYTVRDEPWDVVLAALFGLAGHVFHKLGCAPAPLLLGFVLGPWMEVSLRRALALSDGDWSSFVTRPLSAGLLLAALLLVVAVSLPSLRRRRERVFDGAD